MYGVKPEFDKHIENCSGIPGIVYNFNSHNLVSFENNIGYKGGLTLVVYNDFEKTASTDCFNNPEQRRIFVVSYVIVFAFYPKLNLDCTVVKRSFGHSYKKFTTIEYLSNDQMECLNIKLMKQLKNCAINVS